MAWFGVWTGEMNGLILSSLAGKDTSPHCIYGIRQDQEFDIHTTAEWRQLGMTAESRPKLCINPSDVPEHFRPLIPLAERWAIRCDVTRGDYFEKQPHEDICKFAREVEPYGNAIEDWLATLGEVRHWPEGAVLFMYMLKAHAEAFYALPRKEQDELRSFPHGCSPLRVGLKRLA